MTRPSEPPKALPRGKDKNQPFYKNANNGAILSALNEAALITIMDVHRKITYANDNMLRACKYVSEELIGKQHEFLLPENERKRVLDQIWESVLQGKTWRGELQNVAKDGSLFWVDMMMTPIPNEQGALKEFLAVRFLITNRKQEEHLLQQMLNDLQTFKKAVDSAYESIVITDLNAVIRYVNPAFTKLTGYTSKEAIGQNPRLLQSGKTPPELYDKMWKELSMGKTFQSDEIINMRKDGSEYCSDIAIYPVMSKNGKPEFFVGVQRDITLRKREEQSKTEFISIASHQLRTPVTGLRLSLELLLNNRFGALTEKQREILEPAYTYAVNLAETIRMMLAVSHIEEGKSVFQISEIEVCPLLRDLADQYKFLLQSKKLSVSVDCNEDLTIRSDKISVHEIVSNLFTNAIRYTPDGGSIALRASRDGDRLRLEVNDSGIGIPAYEQERVFQKLFRAANARRTVTDGTGLGLYLVRNLVTLLGGTVSFVSREHKGTTFTVLLPLTSSQ